MADPQIMTGSDGRYRVWDGERIAKVYEPDEAALAEAHLGRLTGRRRGAPRPLPTVETVLDLTAPVARVRRGAQRLTQADVENVDTVHLKQFSDGWRIYDPRIGQYLGDRQNQGAAFASPSAAGSRVRELVVEVAEARAAQRAPKKTATKKATATKASGADLFSRAAMEAPVTLPAVREPPRMLFDAPAKPQMGFKFNHELAQALRALRVGEVYTLLALQVPRGYSLLGAHRLVDVPTVSERGVTLKLRVPRARSVERITVRPGTRLVVWRGDVALERTAFMGDNITPAEAARMLASAPTPPVFDMVLPASPPAATQGSLKFNGGKTRAADLTVDAVVHLAPHHRFTDDRTAYRRAVEALLARGNRVGLHWFNPLGGESSDYDVAEWWNSGGERWQELPEIPGYRVGVRTTRHGTRGLYVARRVRPNLHTDVALLLNETAKQNGRYAVGIDRNDPRQPFVVLEDGYVIDRAATRDGAQALVDGWNASMARKRASFDPDTLRPNGAAARGVFGEKNNGRRPGDVTDPMLQLLRDLGHAGPRGAVVNTRVRGSARQSSGTRQNVVDAAVRDGLVVADTHRYLQRGDKGGRYFHADTRASLTPAGAQELARRGERPPKKNGADKSRVVEVFPVTAYGKTFQVKVVRVGDPPWEGFIASVYDPHSPVDRKFWMGEDGMYITGTSNAFRSAEIARGHGENAALYELRQRAIGERRLILPNPFETVAVATVPCGICGAPASVNNGGLCDEHA